MSEHRRVSSRGISNLTQQAENKPEDDLEMLGHRLVVAPAPFGNEAGASPGPRDRYAALATITRLRPSALAR